MASVEPVCTAIESTPSMIDELGKAVTDLEHQREASADCKVQWKEIEEHFLNLEKSLKKRFDELEEEEAAFKEKETETYAKLAQREAEVKAKEQASLDRIQELKDAALAAIAEACEKYKIQFPEPAANSESKVSSSSGGDPNAPVSVTEGKFPEKSSENADATAVEVKPRPELTQFCEQMDVKGLLNFISENRKSLVAIREEIPIALKNASEPARLVLDALEGFYPLPEQTIHQENKKDPGFQGLRRSCIMLMESVAPLLVGTKPSENHPLSSETKQQAKAIADEWKTRLDGMDVGAANGNSLEAQAFLQLLATFCIALEFDEDELCKLVLAIAHRRQTPDLCRSLGLTHKMPGVIQELVNAGKLIDAVHLVQAFGLSESFPPVPLLKTYLKDLRRNSQGNSGNALAAGVQNDANAQELSALKAVIKCVEDYKLEAEYPLDPLQKRFVQLEKAKSDRKRIGDATKPQPKRPRANIGYGPRMPYGAADRQAPPPPFVQRGLNQGGLARYPYAGPPAGPPTYNYEVPGQAIYGQQQLNAPGAFYHPDEKVPSASAGVSTYGGYMGSGLQPSNQPYM